MFLNRYYKKKNKHLWLWQRISFYVIMLQNVILYVIIVEHGIYSSCALHHIWVIYNLVIQHSLSMYPGLIRNRTIHCTRSKMTSCHMKNVQWTLKILSVKHQSRLLFYFIFLLYPWSMDGLLSNQVTGVPFLPSNRVT